LIVIVATILVIQRLKIKGTSAELKKKVFERHIIYSLFYVTSLMQVYIHFYSPYLLKHVSQTGFQVMELINNFIGIPLALIRLLEPFVW